MYILIRACNIYRIMLYDDDDVRIFERLSKTSSGVKSPLENISLIHATWDDMPKARVS